MTASGATAVPRTLEQRRYAAAAAFFAQGLVFISLTTRLPTVQRIWDFDELQMSLLLLMMVLLAGIGSVAAERLSASHDSARLLRIGLGVITLAVPTLVLAPQVGVFFVGLAAYGIGLGMVDATSNMQAVAVEHRYGRPILPSFHGAWTLGGATGAALTLLTASWAFELTAALALVPLAVSLAPFLPRAGIIDLGSLAGINWRPILLVGLAMVVFYLVDTAAFTWGPIYLDRVFPTPERLVALATFPYLIASGLVRLWGDRLVHRHGAVTVLRVGTVVAFAALVLIVAAPTWPLAVLGFTLVGAGVAVVAPLSFSAAARIAGDATTIEGEAADDVTRQTRVDAVIGRFNQFNYAGALLGAVMTGMVGSGSLRVGFAVPMVLVLVLWPLARAFAGQPAEARSQDDL